MSLPTLPAPRSLQSRCSVPCRPALRSGPLWQTGYTDPDGVHRFSPPSTPAPPPANTSAPDPDLVTTGTDTDPNRDVCEFSTTESRKMNDALRSGMLKATHLTAAGRLKEASAFLQRMLRDDSSHNQIGR